MAIQRPEPILLHHVPLQFVRKRVTGHGRKAVDHQIPLIPFIDFLIVLVIFLLMSFSASGELVAQQPTITMPKAKNTEQIEISPIVAVDERVITLDGTRVADTQTQGQSAQVDRIMQGYIRETGGGPPGSEGQYRYDERGEIVSGWVTYRHTDKGWGDADLGVVTLSQGRVTETEFLPD